MENLVLQPSVSLKKLWHLVWMFWTMCGFVVIFSVFQIQPSNWIVYVGLGWTLIMLLVVIWVNLFYKSFEYSMDPDNILIQKGVFFKKQISISASKIITIDITQGPLERAFEVGTIVIKASGASAGSSMEIKLIGINNLEHVRNQIMERASYEAIKREVAVERDSEIFSRMLKELSSIREILEKNSSK